jgi:hypothetical protein
MRRPVCHSLLLCAALLVPACAALRPKKKSAHAPPPPPPTPLLIGSITLVNETGRFVLIDTGLAPAPAAGAVLKSYTGSVASGELESGAARHHPFLIADIKSGAPQKGDHVFFDPIRKDGMPAPVAIPVGPAVPAPAASATPPPQDRSNPFGLPPGLR